jgi:ubiquitin C-terminal hydrolase
MTNREMSRVISNYDTNPSSTINTHIANTSNVLINDQNIDASISKSKSNTFDDIVQSFDDTKIIDDKINNHDVINENVTNVAIDVIDSNDKNVKNDENVMNVKNDENVMNVKNDENVMNDKNDENVKNNKNDDYQRTRGLSGIANVGNTCYMNSALQSLSATKHFLAYLIHSDSSVINDIENVIYLKMKKDHEKKYGNIDMDVNPMQMRIETTNTLTYRTRSLFKILWRQNCEVQPKSYKKSINTHLQFFAGYQQQDAYEFINLFLDKIHEETKASAKYIDIETIESSETTETTKEFKKQFEVIDYMYNMAVRNRDIENRKIFSKKLHEIYTQNEKMAMKIKATNEWKKMLKDSYSVVNDIFSGLISSQIKCNKCDITFHNFEKYEALYLHIPETVDKHIDSYTIDELLESYTSEDLMKDGSQYFCMHCNEKQDAIKRSIIYQLPNVLVIVIKKYQKHNGKIFKSNIKIKYSHLLNMSKYTYDNNIDRQSNESVEMNNYELYSVIKHAGSVSGGHYYAYTKNAINGLWYLYDDSSVYNVNENEPIDCNGYVLFYRKYTK